MATIIKQSRIFTELRVVKTLIQIILHPSFYPRVLSYNAETCHIFSFQDEGIMLPSKHLTVRRVASDYKEAKPHC